MADFTDIWNSIKIQQSLESKTNAEISDLLLIVWSEMDCMSPQAVIIEEAMERLNKGE
jgi:hypothetical protein